MHEFKYFITHTIIQLLRYLCKHKLFPRLDKITVINIRNNDNSKDDYDEEDDKRALKDVIEIFI